MKDTKQIRKLIYIGKNDIALIVLNTINESKNILFADQVAIDNNTNLQGKVSELLTNAANFLGFNIKDVEMIFDDPQVIHCNYQNAEFVDCACEEDISKEIFKKAKIDNYFVNEINFQSVQYDEIDKVAKVNCNVCASDYITYKKYVNLLKACNLVVTNSTNLYKLLKSNKEQIELTIKIDGQQAIACEYYGQRLNNINVINLDLNAIKEHTNQKFNISFEKIDQVLAIANQLAETDDVDNQIVNNYYMKTKSFTNVKASDIIALYKDEVRSQINECVDYRNFQNVMVVSKDKINCLEGFAFFENDQIGLERLSLDKLISLNNIDTNKDEITQFSFENKINNVNLLA